MVNNLCHQIHQKHVLNMRSSFWASINDLHLNKEAGHGMLIIGSSFGKVHVSCKKRSLQFSLVECHPDLVLVSLHAWAPDTQKTSERTVSLSQQASRDLNRKDLLQKDQVIFWLRSLRFLVYNQVASKCISTFQLALEFHEAFDVLCSGQCRTKPCDKLSPTVKRTNQNAKSAGCIFLRLDTKTSSMSLANHNRCRKSNEPIRMPSQLAKFSHALIQGHLRSQAREKSVIFVYGTSDKSKKWYNILFIHKRLKVTHLSLYYKSLFLSLQTK